MSQAKRLVFCTYPSIYSSIVLDALIASPDIQISAIVVSERNLKIRENPLVSDLRRIRHSGLHYALYLWCVTSLYSAIGSLITKRCVISLAKRHGISVIKTQNINEDSVLETLKSLQPDYFLCAHFNQLVSEEIYGLANEAALNIHPSLLPDLKGVDPGFYALSEDYSQTGVSLHKLDKAFDEGEILSQSIYQIHKSDTLFTLNSTLFKSGAQLAVDYFTAQSGVIPPSKDNTHHTTSRYDSWPSRLQVRHLRQKRKLLSLADLVSFCYKSS